MKIHTRTYIYTDIVFASTLSYKTSENFGLMKCHTRTHITAVRMNADIEVYNNINIRQVAM